MSMMHHTILFMLIAVVALFAGTPNLCALQTELDLWKLSEGQEHQEGMQYLRAGQFDEAIKYAKRKLRERPNDADVVTLLSLAYLGMDDHVQAMKQAARCGRLDPAQGFIAYKGIAQYYQVKKRPFRALVAAREALAIRPDTQLAEMVSNIYLAHGRLSEAKAILDRSSSGDRADRALSRICLIEGAYEQVVKLGERLREGAPDDLQLHIILGSAYLMLDQLDSARATYERAKTLAPEFLEADYYLGLIDLAGRQPELAAQRLNALAEQAPQMRTAPLAAAIAWHQAGDLDAAESAALEALKIDGKDPLSHLALACIRISQGRAQEADPLLLGAAEMYPDFQLPGFSGTEALKASETFRPADFALANLFLMEGLSHPALRLANDSTHPFLTLAKSRASIKLGDQDAARKALTRLTTEARPLLSPWLELGELEAASGDVAAAIHAYEEAARIASHSPEVQLRLGNLYYANGDFDAAISMYRNVVALAPQATIGYNQLAWVLAEKKQAYEEALTHARKGRELDPDNIALADTLGWIYHLSGQQEASTEVYRGLVDKRILDPSICYRLGLAFNQAGELQQATRYFEQALNLSSSFPESAQAASQLGLSMP